MEKTFYEFFAGIGLVRMGLEKDGWRCIWANDISEDKHQLYSLNFGDHSFCRKDIRELKSSELPGEAFLATASFPCTDLSLAGKRNGLAGSESSTFYSFIEILKGLKAEKRLPPIVMLENVVGLLSSHKGADIRQVLQSLAGLDYCLDIIKLDAIHFVPQSRPRIFIFGVRHATSPQAPIKNINKEFLFHNWALKTDLRPSAIKEVMFKNPDLPWCPFDLPSPPIRRSSLAEVIEEIPHSSPLWWSEAKSQKLYSQMSAKHKNLIQQLLMNDKYLYGTVYRRKRKGGSMA